ncbi:MAG: DUF1735 domain-containing protein [Flavisolibacter sp.]|nr:DUF1735 domain-containing protein [Flavisolibacter sp.]
MKKLFLNNKYLYFTLALSFFLSSCLKDKGFDNGEYGTVNRNTEGQKWISIPLGAFKTNAIGVESRAAFQSIDLFPVSFDYKDPAATDITVTVQVNNDLVTAADPSIIILPPSAYNIPSNTLTVKAGERISDVLALSINTSTLDPSKKYGIGFSITGVSDPSIQMSSNLKNAVFVFTIKNKYDGIYRYSAEYDIPADRDPAWLRSFTYGFEVHLLTTGPRSVSFLNTAFNAGFIPLMVPGASGFGGTGMAIVFDENDKVISVTNPVPPDSRNRQVALNPSGNSRYDNATKTLYLDIIFTQNGFDPIPMRITMTFLRVRP